MQFDLETTGPRPRARPDLHGRACATRPARPRCSRRDGDGDAAEADLIRRLVARGPGGRSRRDREPQPARLRPPVPRSPRAAARRAAGARPHRAARLRQRAARRGVAMRRRTPTPRRVRFVAPGRELIDTLDAVLRHDFSTRDAARPRAQGGRAAPRHRRARSRAHPRRSQIHEVYRRDPERVRRYAQRRRRGSRGARRACSAAPRSRSRGWRRAATSGSPTPAPRPA